MKTLLAALSTNYLLLALTLGANLVMLPVLLDQLGTERTGIYFLLLSISNFLSLSIGWLNQAGLPLLAERLSDRSAFHRMQRALTLAYVCAGALIFAGFFGASFLIGTVWLRETSWINEAQNACMLLGIVNLLTFLQSAQTTVFNVLNQQTLSSLLRCSSTLLFAVTAIVVLLLFQRIDLLVLTQVAAQLLLLGIAHQMLRRANPQAQVLPFPRQELRKIFGVFGANYFAVGVLQFLLIYGDIFLVGYFFGAPVVSLFVIMSKAPEFATLIVSRISEVLMPFLARESDQAVKGKLLHMTLRYNLMLNAAAVVGFSFAGQALLTLWVGPEHTPSGAGLYFLAAFASFFQATNRHVILCHVALAKIEAIVPVIILELLSRLVVWIIAVEAGFSFESAFIACIVVNISFVFWRMQSLGETIAQNDPLRSPLLSTYIPPIAFALGTTLVLLALQTPLQDASAQSIFLTTTFIITGLLLAALWLTSYRDARQGLPSIARLFNRS